MEKPSTAITAAFRARSRWLLPAIGMAASLAACSSNPPTPSVSASAPNHAETQRTPSASRPHAPATAAAPSSRAGSDALARNAQPAKHSVYFDYDSSLVKDEYRNVIATNASWVSSHRTPHVVIQGNTDERGSREYNLALGQRRADAVKQHMTLLGVPAPQIETVSFGEEKPRVDDETDQAFAENRRADIVYSAR
jgi:peptidoglycan-associated lipoprotein